MSRQLSCRGMCINCTLIGLLFSIKKWQTFTRFWFWALKPLVQWIPDCWPNRVTYCSYADQNRQKFYILANRMSDVCFVLIVMATPLYIHTVYMRATLYIVHIFVYLTSSVCAIYIRFYVLFCIVSRPCIFRSSPLLLLLQLCLTHCDWNCQYKSNCETRRFWNSS